MIRVLDGRDFDDVDAFVKALNAERLANPQRWLVYVGHVIGKAVQIKTFGHGDLQIVRVNDRDMRGAEYGLNVGAWKNEIAMAIRRAA